jgi:hypothetical protein
MEPAPAWEERWEQCWPLLLGHLSARDLICLCLSSRSAMTRLNRTPGWWQQACHSCLCWPKQTASTLSQNQPAGSASTPSMQRARTTAGLPEAAADDRARHVLFAATALAHHVKLVRSPPPTTVQIPPWLPGQPGVTKGLTRVDPSSLSPPLALTPTQLSWLAYGSLSGVCLIPSGRTQGQGQHQCACAVLPAASISH